MVFVHTVMKFEKHLLDTVQILGIDTKDAPDFVDAYIESAYYDGHPMTESQLEAINDDRELILELVNDQLY